MLPAPFPYSEYSSHDDIWAGGLKDLHFLEGEGMGDLLPLWAGEASRGWMEAALPAGVWLLCVLT